MEKKMFLTLLTQLQMKVDNTAYGLIQLNLETYGEVSLWNNVIPI